jgi:pilus assembly protein CpaF
VTNLVDSIAENARQHALSRATPQAEAIAHALDSAFESDLIGANARLEQEIAQAVSNQINGYGSLDSLMNDDSIEEIWINSPDKIFIARAGQNQLTNIKSSAAEIKMLVERMLRASGRRVDRSVPFVDASLSDGSRLHVAIPDITAKHWSVNIRKFPNRIFRLSELVARGVLEQHTADNLARAIVDGKNILVSGATQAGKTTLLCALLAELPTHERLVSVEDTFEIRSNSNDWVALQTRPASIEGQGEISLRRLIKEALRMRPSRIAVGEVREAEALDLLIALNSGLPGICTIHANSAQEAIAKLCTLPLLAGQNIPSEFIKPTVASCIDLVIHCQLDSSGKRTVAEVAEVSMVGDDILAVAT